MTPEAKALLQVIYNASLKLRTLGYEGEEKGLTPRQASKVADLADAIHNIPEAVLIDNEQFREYCLNTIQSYDEKYRDTQGINLLEIYEQALEKARSKT